MNCPEDNGQSPCCENGGCCSSPAPGGNKMMRWKTIIFTIVVLSACSVAAYSLFWRADGKANSGCCPSASTACATPCGPDSTGAGAVNDSLSGVQLQHSTAVMPCCDQKNESKKAGDSHGMD